MVPSLCAASIALSWLIPNHYLPWTAAWPDSLALTGLCLLALWSGLLLEGPTRLSRPLLMAAALAFGSVLVQSASGKILFIGDALLAAAYLAAWGIAVLTGHRIASSPAGDTVQEALFNAWLFVAISSVGVGLVQWTGALGSTVYIVDLPPAGNPWANVAQTSHFSTICFIGLCSLGCLHQRQRVGLAVFGLAAVFLMVGMVSSGSRTAWLQMACLIAWLSVYRSSKTLRLPRMFLGGLATTFIALVIAWPGIADAALLSSGRLRDDQLSSGFRVRHWAMMLDAIGREPWLGYGWQQVSVAQQAVALDHPAIGEYIESSHNLLLDLMLWNGIPVGLAIGALLIFWFLSRARRCADAHSAWLLGAIGGLFVHAMVEFPLEYAYFLIPFGLLMGMVDAAMPSLAGWRVGRGALLGITLLTSLVLFGIARDYFRAEENHRVLRLESARIGVDSLVTPAPQLALLDQLEAFLLFARIEPRPGLPAAELALMQTVASRYGTPAVLLNYAIASGLNGRPDLAELTLARLCRIHRAEQCSAMLLRWKATVQLIHPQLGSIPIPALR